MPFVNADPSKWALRSKGVLGSLVAIAAAVGLVVNPEAVGDVERTITAAAAIAGALLALYGRVQAREVVAWRRSSIPSHPRAGGGKDANGGPVPGEGSVGGEHG